MRTRLRSCVSASEPALLHPTSCQRRGRCLKALLARVHIHRRLYWRQSPQQLQQRAQQRDKLSQTWESSRLVGTIHTADKCPVKCCCENPIEWSKAVVEMRLEAPARAWRKVEVHASCMRVPLARVCSVPDCDFRRWNLRVLCRRGRVDSSVERRWKQGSAKQGGQKQQQAPCSWRCHQGENMQACPKERHSRSCRPCQSSACCQSPPVCSPSCRCCRRLEQTTVRCPQSRGRKRRGRRFQ